MEESVNWQFDVYMQEMFHMKEVIFENIHL